MQRGKSAFVIVVAVSLAACVQLDGLAAETETGLTTPNPLPSGGAASGSSGTAGAPGATKGNGSGGGGAEATPCASAAKQMKDGFDREAPAGNGWIPGNSGIAGMGIAQASDAPSASNVLHAHLDRRHDSKGWAQPILQRELPPATSCVAVDFAIKFAQDGELDHEASTELVYVVGASTTYVNIFRRESGAFMAAGVDGLDKLTTTADFPRGVWTHVHLEVELQKDNGIATVSFDGGKPHRLVEIPKLKPPIWVALGGYSQGKAAAQDVLYDDVTLSY